MSRSLVWLLALWGCNNKDEKEPAPVESSCTDLVWQLDAEPFFRNWCTPCHSSSLSTELRQGAPVGIDFDTLEGVARWSDQIVSSSLMEQTSMPPAGGTTAAERALVLEWIECELPGTDPLPAPTCETATPVVADLSVGSQAEADVFCAQGEFVDLQGSVSVFGNVSLDCLCAISGDVTVSAGTFGGQQLTSVGGDVVVQDQAMGTVLPRLDQIAGQLWVHDNDRLTQLDMPWVRTVGGSVIFERNPSLAVIRTPRLASSGGEVRFESLPALTTLYSVEALNDIAGNLIIRDVGVPELFELWAFVRVGGGIYIQNNPNIDRVANFLELQEVGTTFEISGNPLLQEVYGFLAFVESDGSLVVKNNPSLQRVEFEALTRVGASDLSGKGIELAASPLLTVFSFPALVSTPSIDVQDTGLLTFDGFPSLASVVDIQLLENQRMTLARGSGLLTHMGSLRVQNNRRLVELKGFEGLSSVAGDVTIATNADMEHLQGLSAIQSVGGDLDLSMLGFWQDLSDVGSLTTVDGDLTLRGNPMLDSTAAVGFVDGLTVGGTVTIEDNL